MEKEKLAEKLIAEKIDVPHFDGWEAFYGRPRDHDGCRILSSNGKDLIPVYGCEEYIKDWPQICYRKIKPKRITLEFEQMSGHTVSHGKYYLHKNRDVPELWDCPAKFTFGDDVTIWQLVKE